MAEEVIGEILWTDSAKTSFSKIIDYLHTEWTEKEVGKFINDNRLSPFEFKALSRNVQAICEEKERPDRHYQ